MQALLTSAGLTNATLIAEAKSLSSSFAERRVALIPTASWPGSGDRAWFVDSLNQIRAIADVFDIIEPIALQTSESLARLEAANIVVIAGGDVSFLLGRLHERELVEPIRELLRDRIYIGISAGSIVAGPDVRWLYDLHRRDIGPRDYVEGLAIAPVAVHPHLGRADGPSPSSFASVAAALPYPAFEIDDASAVRVMGTNIEGVGEGISRLVNRSG